LVLFGFNGRFLKRNKLLDMTTLAKEHFNVTHQLFKSTSFGEADSLSFWLWSSSSRSVDVVGEVACFVWRLKLAP